MSKLILFVLVVTGSTLGYSQYSNKLANKQLMDSLIRAYDIKHPDIVLRQAMYESGWLQCTNCSWDHNNPFGFFWKGKYLEFDTLEDAVKYYKWWQDKLYHGEDYYVFLKRVGYAEQINYNNYLKKMW